MLRTTLTFVLLFVAWLMWSGHTELELVALGLGSCVLVVWLSARMGILDEEGYPWHLAVRLLSYVPWVIYQVVVTNIDAARVILSPSLPIHPHLVKLRVTQKTTLGKVIHANTITITPGTVTLDVRDDTFLIHALTKEAADADSSGALDRKVSRLEGQ